VTIPEVRDAAIEALTSLDADIQAALVDVEIHIVMFPQDAACDLATTPPHDAQGVYVGTVLEGVDEDEDKVPGPAGTVYLFATNLADVDDVHLALWHELGHALGLDEDEVEGLGL
jgi:predicted Zn-dependent protease with MMP-like domain